MVFCNEVIKQVNVFATAIRGSGLCGIKVTNSKEWTSFNSLSAWIAKGIEVEHLLTGGGRGETGPTNLFPEIAYALLTDERIGAGQLIGEYLLIVTPWLGCQVLPGQQLLLGWRNR